MCDETLLLFVSDPHESCGTVVTLMTKGRRGFCTLVLSSLLSKGVEMYACVNHLSHQAITVPFTSCFLSFPL